MSVKPFTQVRYRTTNGTVFDIEATASAYDREFRACRLALRPLSACKPDSLNSREYFQHDPEIVWATREALLRAIIKHNLTGRDHAAEMLDHVIARKDLCWGLTMYGRYLDNGWPVEKSWYRLGAIGNDGREWNQVYYTTPEAEKDRARSVCVNPPEAADQSVRVVLS